MPTALYVQCNPTRFVDPSGTQGVDGGVDEQATPKSSNAAANSRDGGTTGNVVASKTLIVIADPRALHDTAKQNWSKETVRQWRQAAAIAAQKYAIGTGVDGGVDVKVVMWENLSKLAPDKSITQFISVYHSGTRNEKLPDGRIVTIPVAVPFPNDEGVPGGELARIIKLVAPNTKEVSILGCNAGAALGTEHKNQSLAGDIKTEWEEMSGDFSTLAVRAFDQTIIVSVESDTPPGAKSPLGIRNMNTFTQGDPDAGILPVELGSSDVKYIEGTFRIKDLSEKKDEFLFK